MFDSDDVFTSTVCHSVQQLEQQLHTYGCQRCPLGSQPECNGPALYRGNPSSKRMLIGEALGKEEDILKKPFVGPAGKLLDKIFAAVGWDTNKDWYLTNTILCRPLAPYGSGKENLTPTQEYIDACRGYLIQQVAIIRPRIIVLCGGVALQSVLNRSDYKITKMRGKLIIREDQLYFPMLHPASLIHAEKNSKEQYDEYRSNMWEDIQALKKIITEREI